MGKIGGDYLVELRRKGIYLIMFFFDVLEMVDDLFFLQLERSVRGFEKVFLREGFEVLGWNIGWYGVEKVFVMFEFDRVERLRVKIYFGLEFFMERGRDFYRKNERVWFVGKRFYVEKRVKENIIDVVRELFEKNQVVFGKNLWEIVKGVEIFVDYVLRFLENEVYFFFSREKEGFKYQG